MRGPVRNGRIGNTESNLGPYAVKDGGIVFEEENTGTEHDLQM